MAPVIICLLYLLLTISLIVPPHTQKVMTVAASLATEDEKKESVSPVFDRQEVIDEEKSDLINMKTSKTGIGSKYIDIKSVTYSSDGQFLNATLWLSSFTHKPARDEVFYGVLADADLDNNTGIQGVDYKVEIAWNKTEGNWKKTFGEFSHAGNERLIEQPFNITLSSGEKQGYIKLELDLSSMLTPEKYKLFFYAYSNPPLDPYSGKEKGSGILDAVRWAYVPPPEFTISTEPKFIKVRAGEEEDILVQVNSTTGLQPIVIVKPTISSSNISMEMIDDNLSLPSFGIATTRMKVKPDNDADPGLHRFFINGNLSFPTAHFTLPISNVTIPIESRDVQKQANGLLNLFAPLTPIDQFRIWINDWFNPISGIITLIMSVATGVIGWGIGSKKSKRRN